MGWFGSRITYDGAPSPRSRMKQTQLAQRVQCGWNSNGWTCKYARANVLINNTRVACRFCRFHQCKKNGGDAPCGVPTAGGFPFCQNHTRCTATSGGARCTNYVKGMNANKYKFCAQYHCCSKDDCENPRTIDNDVDLKYCTDHRCAAPGCKKESGPKAVFCPGHTCEGASCAAYARGGGDPGSWERYCDRHRVCMSDGCDRLCHIHEDGIASKRCGLHYCRVSGCDEARHGDEACKGHTCAEAGCAKPRSEGASTFCKSHECKAAGCFFKKRRGDWCPEHMCSRPSCDKGAERNGYCQRHQLCTVPNCDRYRATVGEAVLERCDDHSATICGFGSCEQKVVTSRSFCPAHLCTIRECTNPVTGTPSALCAVHKCSLPHCIAPRWVLPAHPALMPSYAAMMGASTSVSAAIAPSPYCVQHACSYPTCAERAEPDTQRCRDHTRCRRDGCPRFPDRAGNSTYCPDHRPAHSYHLDGLRPVMGTAVGAGAGPNYVAVRRCSPDGWEVLREREREREGGVACAAPLRGVGHGARCREEQRAGWGCSRVRRASEERRSCNHTSANVDIHLPRCR